MSADAMDIDSPSPAPGTPEKKRKSKHSEQSPSKKRKKTKHAADDTTLTGKKSTKSSFVTTWDESNDTDRGNGEDSPFRLITATMYVPLSPISISTTHALSSLVAEHLAPLLLTYYPPFKGLVLAFSDAWMSSHMPTSPTKPTTSGDEKQDLTLALSTSEFGVLYVYLTATFLVFSPRRGHILEGHVNVQSEGFLGAVVYNLFSVGIDRRRLPANWRWVPPGEDGQNKASPSKQKKKKEKKTDDSYPDDFDPEKEQFRPVQGNHDANDVQEEQDDDAEGYFESVSGYRVRGMIRFRVRDVDVIPGSDPDRGFISIEGTMLSEEEEEQQQQHRTPTSWASPLPVRSSSSTTPATNGQISNETAETEETDKPRKSKEKKDKKDKKDKSKKKDK
ncbi:hypothetical protein VTN49DRAFT_6241 [Thermomyces lanuginosus]|uniref:uncharacterized protein n=1 Tax=Thermomyces lanuginosus TaxID=5541 RepID=UPI003742262E